MCNGNGSCIVYRERERERERFSTVFNFFSSSFLQSPAEEKKMEFLKNSHNILSHIIDYLPSQMYPCPIRPHKRSEQ